MQVNNYRLISHFVERSRFFSIVIFDFSFFDFELFWIARFWLERPESSYESSASSPLFPIPISHFQEFVTKSICSRWCRIRFLSWSHLPELGAVCILYLTIFLTIIQNFFRIGENSSLYLWQYLVSSGSTEKRFSSRRPRRTRRLTPRKVMPRRSAARRSTIRSFIIRSVTSSPELKNE